MTSWITFSYIHVGNLPKLKNNDSWEISNLSPVSYFFTMVKKFHKKVNWTQYIKQKKGNRGKVSDWLPQTVFLTCSKLFFKGHFPFFFFFKGKGGYIAEIKLFWLTDKQCHCTLVWNIWQLTDECPNITYENKLRGITFNYENSELPVYLGSHQLSITSTWLNRL